MSEYTDKIDTIGFGLSKAKRIVQLIRELCAIMSGLLLAADYKRGQELFSDKDFQANGEFYQLIFELGRRHKIMNPDKMRTEYGKLIYLLQFVCSAVNLASADNQILLPGIANRQKSRNYWGSHASGLSRRFTRSWKNTANSTYFEMTSFLLPRRRFIPRVDLGGRSRRTSKQKNVLSRCSRRVTVARN